MTALSACSPYPDDGEFLAGVVYAQTFIAGTKTIDRLPAVGRGHLMGAEAPTPYALIASSNGNTSATPATSAAVGRSPFWTDSTKRNPLAVSSAQKVYFFDGSCASPPDYRYDERLDLIRWDRQYPVFEDIPELLTANSGKPGRKGGYSAVVEVIHVRAPGDLPCQALKRFETVKSRIGQDLTEIRREYRLYQIIDPALVPARSIPDQRGFFDQLVVPYIDMGPVPLEPDGQTFATMPLYKVYRGASTMGAPAQVVVFGTAREPLPMLSPQPVYSPICRDYLLLNQASLPPPDAAAMPYRSAMRTENLSSCIVCDLIAVDSEGSFSELDCPFSQSQLGLP